MDKHIYLVVLAHCLSHQKKLRTNSGAAPLYHLNTISPTKAFATIVIPSTYLLVCRVAHWQLAPSTSVGPTEIDVHCKGGG